MAQHHSPSAAAAPASPSSAKSSASPVARAPRAARAYAARASATAAAEGGPHAAIAAVQACSVVGVLPQPHAIIQRVYQPNDFTALWLSTFTWSTIYLALARDLPLFDAAAIRLFQIAGTA